MSWKLYEGDCFDYLPLLEDKSIDMILCDLPYGTTACKWDTPLPLEQLWIEYKRVIKDNGAIVLTASQPFTTTLIHSNINNFRYEWIWSKSNGGGFLNANRQPLKRHENILIFSKEQSVYNPLKTEGIPYSCRRAAAGETTQDQTVAGWVTENNGSRYPTTVLNFSNDIGLHPTQKPVKLFEYLIKTYTNEHDLVLDNCAGSGTTGVACENLNRNSILMEQESEYCQIIRERMATVQELQLEARKQKTLNEFNGQATLDMPAK
jgi:site-specific DNA-methyltransferase (adenine-specific)